MKTLINIVIITICAILSFGMYNQFSLYKKKPSNVTWKSVDRFTKQLSSTDEMMIFYPDWLAGYAVDHRRMKHIGISSNSKLSSYVENKTPGIWIASIDTLDSAEKLLLENDYKITINKTFGRLSIKKFVTNKNNIVFSYNKNLSAGKAFLEDSNGNLVQEGIWENDRFRFPLKNHSWFDIKTNFISHSFATEREYSIWMHPADKYVKKIRFLNIELGRRLVVDVGLADSGRQYKKILPVFFSIFVNNKQIKRLKIDEQNSLQYVAYEIDGHKKRGDVTFQVESPSGNFKRHIFFRAFNLK